jgi:glutamate-1-semialdehyde 2,1-aminomutase
MGGMLGLALSNHPVRNFEDAKAADHDLFAKFFWAMLERGVWLPPSGYEAMFVSIAHDDGVIERVVEAAEEAFQAASR